MIAFILLGLFFGAIFHHVTPIVVGVCLAWLWRWCGKDFLKGVKEGRMIARAEKVAMAMRCDEQDRMARENDPRGTYGDDYTLIVTQQKSEPLKTVPGVIYPPEGKTSPYDLLRGRESLPEEAPMYPVYPRPTDWGDIIDLDAEGAVR